MKSSKSKKPSNLQTKLSKSKMREFCQLAVATGMLDLNEALVEAARKGKTKIVEALLDGGADVHASVYVTSSGTRYKDDALCAAAGAGHVETIKVLLANGADINANRGRPLCDAADNSRETSGTMQDQMRLRDSWGAAAVKVLLDAGADVHAHGIRGFRDNALLLAAWRGYPRTVKVLLEGGSDQHRCALREAENGSRDEDVIELLLEDGKRKGIFLLQKPQ